jgi:hypothetical protein
MYEGRTSQWDFTDEWRDKTEQFVDSVFAIPTRPAKVLCPCVKCHNIKRMAKDEMSKHLLKFGFTPNYDRWICHGEQPAKPTKRVRKESQQSQLAGGFDAGFEACFDAFLDGNAPENPNAEETPQEAQTSEEPEQSTKKFYEAMFAAQKPLHPHTEVTQLDAVARLMAFKCQSNLSRDKFDALLVVIGSILPKGHILTKSFYESTKILSSLKMTYEKIDACPKGCMLFRKEHATGNDCIHCKSFRYFEADSGDGTKRQTGIPQKILRYLPFLPRLQRLFMTEESAQQMRWPLEGERYKKDKMIHPSDGQAWQNFAKKYPLKAGNPRSVAVAISTDGFNPYGMSAATYSCWPVFVIPLNLPPGVVMRSENMFVSMIIPGPKYPGKNMSVYLEPLVDDLLVGWNDRGMRTYDASTKEHFDMFVWCHTSLHDLPAHALFCGWCTHGKWPCPVCRQAVTFFWLKKGGKYSCFDETRKFLEANHKYRSDKKNFKKGVVVHTPRPHLPTGKDTKAELEALVPNPDGKGFVGYGETHQWTHIPCLWKLPYFEDLELPHNIDVMHTEKNISEALWSTIMDTEKTKDNIKARLDQQEWCDRPHLDMQPPGVKGPRWTKRKAPFCPSRPERREIFQWIVDCLFFPDGYAANWMRGANLETLRVHGLKSHDYHVWLERIMPIMIRGYVDEETWLVLAELSYFFRQLCAKELDREVVKKLDKQAPELLCKLEMLLPPGFFNPMQHMILHLPQEALLGSTVHTRWQYGPERENKKLRDQCGNKCKIEASIDEATLNKEVSNFTTKYYDEKIPTQHNQILRYNATNPDDVPKLGIFIGLGGTSRGMKRRKITNPEWGLIHSYVLKSMVEVKPYVE